MKESLQKEFKSIALKYVKEFVATEFAIATHYEFSFHGHAFVIYFYNRKEWVFKLSPKKDFTKEIIFKHLDDYEQITFNIKMSENTIIKVLLDIKDFYEEWLMTLELKKSKKINEELDFVRKRVAELEALYDK